MRIQQILEGYERDEVKRMMMSYPEEVAKLKQTGQFDMNGQLYMDLFGYYQDEMPYGTQKARDGDPEEWIYDRLDDLGLLENAEATYDDDDVFFEDYGVLYWNDDNEDPLYEAEYQGRKVKLGKPMAGDVKKFKVYVKNPKGNVVKVNFGQKGVKIKKSNPARRKSFRARHNCDNPGPRHKARYWSCRKW